MKLLKIALILIGIALPAFSGPDASAEQIQITIESFPPATLPAKSAVFSVSDSENQLEVSQRAAQFALSANGWDLESQGGTLVLLQPPDWSGTLYAVRITTDVAASFGYEVDLSTPSPGEGYFLHFHTDEGVASGSNDICESPSNYGVIGGGGSDGGPHQCYAPGWGAFSIVPGVRDISVTDSIAPVDDLAVPFGSVTLGVQSTQTVTVTNLGLSDLAIGNIGEENPLDAPFIVSNDHCSSQTLAYQESCTLNVRFQPNGTGELNDSFDIPSNDPDEDPVLVFVEGNGTLSPLPEISVGDSAGSADDLQVPFGQVLIESTTDQTIAIANIGNADLHLGVIGGEDRLGEPFVFADNQCSGQIVAPSGRCEMTILFTPTATGTFSDSFDVPSDDSNEPSITVSVSGVGTEDPVPDIAVTDDAGFTQDVEIAFGGVPTNKTVDRTVTVTNKGTADLLIGPIASENAIAPPFSLIDDNCSEQTVAPAGSCEFRIHFAPESEALYFGSFDIPSNDPDESSVTFTLSGNGLPPDTNNPPAAFDLLFPADAQVGLESTVTFRWNASTDPEGDPVAYSFCLRAGDSEFTEEDCGPVEDEAPEEGGSMAARSGAAGLALILAGVLFSGSRRRQGWLLRGILLLSALWISACGGGGGGGPDPGPASEITHSVSGLESATTYHWKVIAEDDLGASVESEARQFSTL